MSHTVDWRGESLAAALSTRQTPAWCTSLDNFFLPFSTTAEPGPRLRQNQKDPYWELSHLFWVVPGDVTVHVLPHEGDG